MRNQIGKCKQWTAFKWLATVTLAGCLAAPAGATFPGKNGRIAFIMGPDVYTMNSDGSDIQQLTNLGPDNSASWEFWSPDGTEIAFTEYPPPDGNGQLWLMNADGSNQHLLFAESGFSDEQPSFSPDGGTIVFTRIQAGSDAQAIYRVSKDGTGLTEITPYSTTFGISVQDRGAVYSPDGTKIAFQGQNRGGLLSAIYVMDADGSNAKRITPSDLSGVRPNWSPDGQEIVFASHCCNPQNQELWLVKPDGTELRRLTRNEYGDNYNGYPHDYKPSWSPQGNAIVFERDAPDFSSSAIYILGPGENLAGRPLMIPGSSRSAGLSKAKPQTHRIRRPPMQIEGGGALPRWGATPNN
jgi:Tol biopolymer transport system component